MRKNKRQNEQTTNGNIISKTQEYTNVSSRELESLSRNICSRWQNESSFLELKGRGNEAKINYNLKRYTKWMKRKNNSSHEKRSKENSKIKKRNRQKSKIMSVMRRKWEKGSAGVHRKTCVRKIQEFVSRDFAAGRRSLSLPVKETFSTNMRYKREQKELKQPHQ